MENLIKIQETGLSVSDNVLLRPNALQVHEDELFNTVNASIAKCYADLNLVVPKDPAYLVNEVTKSILNKYPALRLPEIPIAFEKGIRKEYGEYYGLCVVTFEQFIAGYLTSSTRQNLVKERDKLIETKNEPTVDEKFTTAKGLCVDAFERVKQGKAIGLTAVAVYTFLNDIQLIDPDYKKGIMPQALEELVKEKEAESINCFELLKRRRLNADLELLKLNIQAHGITSDQYNECKRVGKRIILNNWMRDITLNEINLPRLIETKRLFYKSK